MMYASFIVIILISVPLLALRLVGESDSKSQIRADQRAQIEDEQFLGEQWHLLETDLAKLEDIVTRQAHSVGGHMSRHRQPQMAALQLSAALIAANQTKNVTVNGALAVVEKKGEPAVDVKATIAEAAMSMTKGPVDKMQLTMMLGMLKNLYEEQKGRISKINKQEANGKKRFDEQEKAYKAKVERIELAHKNGKLNDEFYHNETRDNDYYFQYCKHCRERNHQQFHNSLKITHATMQKEKGMIKAYEETLAKPTPSQGDGGKALAKVAKDVGMPEIVFMQQARVVSRFCQATIADVRDALRDLTAAVPRGE